MNCYLFEKCLKERLEKMEKRPKQKGQKRKGQLTRPKTEIKNKIANEISELVEEAV